MEVLLSLVWCAGLEGLVLLESGRMPASFSEALLAFRSRASCVTLIDPSTSFVTFFSARKAPPALLPSPCPSMMQACRKVFSECSVSLLLGETVAITTVLCRPPPTKQPRNNCVSLFWRKFTNFAPAAVARMQSFSAAREELILAPSFRRSALCSALSMRCSEPARSTRVILPSASPSPAPSPSTKIRQIACEREDWSCTPVAAVARSFVARSIKASSSLASCTGTSTQGLGCTEPSAAVPSWQDMPWFSMSKQLSPSSSTK
mmetsp:Transcript_93701/g.169251  ORF Transcript_93701/g.169251 Transcript_93701/m.169251 type:complete len:262 (-) Transcript_93701:213-998(-)